MFAQFNHPLHRFSTVFFLCHVLPVVIVGSGFAAQSVPDAAFAVIGPALVKGNFHQYPPFYGNVIAPHAVVAKEGVFCTFQDTKGRPVIMAYDIAQKSWTGPVQVSEFGLGKDAHGNPSICIDSKGYIHIFYGCHGRAMRYTRSAKPYDIAKWRQQAAPTGRATYPQSMLMADGTICLFYRAGGHMAPWSLRTSSDDGKTWNEAEKVIEMRLDPADRLAAAYCAFYPGIDNKTIHCFWVHKDDNAARVKGDKKHPWRPLKYKGLHEAVYRYNQYYIFRDEKGIWRNVDGKAVKLPVSKAYADEHCLAFDSGDEFTNIAAPACDEKNRPYARFRYGVGDWKKGGRRIVPWTNKYVRYNYDQRKWVVANSVPGNWPQQPKTIASAEGAAAFGDQSEGMWFIGYRHMPEATRPGSYIFLHHEQEGFINRPGGPARLP